MSFILPAYHGFVKPTAAGGGPQPSDLSGLELWLKANAITGLSDGQEVATWPDSSGNSRDGTGVIGTGVSKPKYRTSLGPASTPAIEMAPGTATGGPWFTLPNFLTGFTAGDIFAVVIINADPPATLNQRCGPPFGDFGSTGDEYFPFHSDGKIYDAFGSTVRKTTVNPTPSLTSWRTYEARSASGAWSNHLDGTQLFTTATNTVGWSTTPFIGHSTASNKHLCGYVAEIIMYSRILDDATERKPVIYAYLNSKYGFSLPV